VADQRISQLAALLQADVDAAADQLPIADVSTAETKKVTPAALVSGVVTTLSGVIPGGAIAPDSLTAVQIAPNAITASELADGAVDTAALLDKAVTAAKIADHTIGGQQIAVGGIGSTELAAGAVGTAALADGAVTSPKISAGAVGTTQLADGGVTGAKVADGAIGTTQLADGGVTAVKMAGDLSGTAFAVQNANVVLAGPAAAGAAAKPSFRALASADLPTATATAKGAVSLLPGGGLSVGVGGELSITNVVTPDTSAVVTYDSKGLVTGGRALTGADLPKAAAGGIGGVEPGAELTVAIAGVLDHVASPVTPGTYPKVTVNQYGHVTAGALLTNADIPSLDASKINTGTFDAARLADRSITQDKLSNFAISFIQEAEPASVDLYHNGMLWYQESTAQLHMWNGNSWMSVGSLGRLGTENMRFCGTFDAATGDILDVTQFGTAGGFAPGPIPAAADRNTGAYFVCKVAGTYNAELYDAGDWVLSLGATKGWVRIDTLNGGSSSVSLRDLLDTTITAPSNGETLIFDSTLNKWVNRPTAGKKATFMEALDGNRSTFTLSADGSAATGLLISLGGVIQEADKDYTFVAPRTVNFSAPPPASSPYWILVEGVPSTGGGGGGGGGGTTLPNGTAAEEYLKWNTTLSAWVAASVLEGGSF